MIELKLEHNLSDEKPQQSIAVTFHPSFARAHQQLTKWLDRFSLFLDESMINDLILFYSLAKRKFLDHRRPEHLARLALSIYHIQKQLLSSSTLFSSGRHLAVRILPTNLFFPFSSKPVLGCVMGMNLLDRGEFFDEEAVGVLLQKHFPELQFVKESYYSHTSQHDSLRICYFEIEKKNGTLFSLKDRKNLYGALKSKLKNSIQKLIPSMFMQLNQEEVYKNILVLSQEIASAQDIPQVHITLDQHTGKEIVFHVTLVRIDPSHNDAFKTKVTAKSFVLERSLPVRYLDGNQIKAHLLRISLPYESSLLRSNGSLNFYVARRKVADLLCEAIGEFRDYNGGLLIKQQELLFSFKKSLPSEAMQDVEITETFFHSIVPLEKQAVLDPEILSSLFLYFLQHRKEPFHARLSLKIHREQHRAFLLVRSHDTSIVEIIQSALQNYLPNTKDWAYNILEAPEEISFNCILLDTSSHRMEQFIQSFQQILNEWNQKRQSEQNLRIALGHRMLSLDPRIGGENVSSNVLELLFEGLTRIKQNGKIENAIAESIDISLDKKRYLFKLRASHWNDGSPLSAHDFVYAWKRVLSPDFSTDFAVWFYCIHNAKEAKEGKISIDHIGVHALDDQTLQVDLIRPTPYFLQLISLPIFSPIHRIVDQRNPEWPYQTGSHYPCNGPFQIKVNQPNQGYKLVKNPLYLNAAQIQLDQITLTPMDTFQATQAFARNEIDWIGNPFGAPTFFPISEKEGKQVRRADSFLSWMVFNTLLHPFDQPKIRQAFALSIDREALLQETSFTATPAYSILFPRDENQHRKIFPRYEKKMAQNLLKEGLKAIGLTAEELIIRLTFPQKSILESLAHGLKKQFEETLGVTCLLQSFSWNTFFQKMTKRQFQIGFINWTPLIHDPVFTLNTLKFAEGGVNFSNWENPEFQRLLDLSEEEPGAIQRFDLLYQAEEILAQSMPLAPLFYQPYEAIVRKDFYINYQQEPVSSFELARSFYHKEATSCPQLQKQ